MIFNHPPAALGATEDELLELDCYTANGFHNVNRALRAGDSDFEAVELLDSLLSKSKTVEPLTVFRGLQAGSLVTCDPAFLSTTTNRAAAELFAGAEGTILQIELPADHAAVSILNNRPPEEDPHEDDPEQRAFEAEVLLPRGLQLELILEGVYKSTQVR